MKKLVLAALAATLAALPASAAEFKYASIEQAVAEATTVRYENLVRYPDRYVGQSIAIAGRVMQVIQVDDKLTLLGIDTATEKKRVRVFHKPEPGERRILVGDQVAVIAIFGGLEQIELVRGPVQQWPTFVALQVRNNPAPPARRSSRPGR